MEAARAVSILTSPFKTQYTYSWFSEEEDEHDYPVRLTLRNKKADGSASPRTNGSSAAPAQP